MLAAQQPPSWLLEALDRWPAGQAVAAAVAAAAHLPARSGACLVAAAARGALQAGPAKPGSDAGKEVEQETHTLVCFEEVLAAVAERMGRGRVGISEAKTWLRGRGAAGAALASRVSRLSKARNCVGHPDVAIVRDVQRLEDDG
eukprot:9998265-Lingulodinium_polyedra.AAC.1